MTDQVWIIDDEKCPLLAREVQTWSWKEDKDGQPTDTPVNLNDDAIMACIYAVEQLSKMKGKPSVLSGVKSMSGSKKDLIELKKEERKKRREVMKEQKKKLREMKKNGRK